MLLYCRLKTLIGDNVCFDRWVGDTLIHFNYYENALEIKNKKFEIVERIPLIFFKFRPSPYAKNLLSKIS